MQIYEGIGQLHAKKRALGFYLRIAARVLVLGSCKVILFCQSLNSLACAQGDRSVTKFRTHGQRQPT